MPETIHSKAAKLMESESYKRRRISQEGYGTFITASLTPEDYWKQAEALRSKAESSKETETLSLYIDTACAYATAQHHAMPDTHRFIQQHHQICKFMDVAITHARKINGNKEKNVLKWALFNFSIHHLFKQGSVISKSTDSMKQASLIRNIQILESLFTSRSTHSYEVVGLDKLESGIRERMLSE